MISLRVDPPSVFHGIIWHGKLGILAIATQRRVCVDGTELSDPCTCCNKTVRALDIGYKGGNVLKENRLVIAMEGSADSREFEDHIFPFVD